MKMTHKLNVARGATSDSGSKSWSSELFQRESLGHNLQALWLPDECMTGSTGVCQDGPPRLFGSATVEVGISKVVCLLWTLQALGSDHQGHLPPQPCPCSRLVSSVAQRGQPCKTIGQMPAPQNETSCF